jgi:hypothetical protein
MAKLPDALIRRGDPELHNIEVDDTVSVDPAAMRITVDLDCYLLPTMAVAAKKAEFTGSESIVTTTAFTLPSLVMTNGRPMQGQKSVQEWIPVASVHQEYEPEVDSDSVMKEKR